MKKAKYDEFQLAKRHKVGYQAFILLLIIVWGNGFVKNSYGVWAEPFLESLVLLFIPGLYFAGASIWNNAYFRLNDHPTLILLPFGIMLGAGLFSLSMSVFSGTFHLIENGKLGGDIGFALFTFLIFMMFVLLFVRRRIDRRSA